MFSPPFPEDTRAKPGSSMASPHVAGLAGLISKRGYGRATIERRIPRAARDVGRRGEDPYYGGGPIEALRAVR